MITFFMIAGLLFVIGTSIMINYLYSIFPITKVTNFILDPKNTIFNKISFSLLPILIWSLIEFPILGFYNYFILGICVNIFINLATMYIMIYGYNILLGEENDLVRVVSIIISSFLGFMINHIILLMAKPGSINSSIIGMIVLIILYLFIKKHPPKGKFKDEEIN